MDPPVVAGEDPAGLPGHPDAEPDDPEPDPDGVEADVLDDAEVESFELSLFEPSLFEPSLVGALSFAPSFAVVEPLPLRESVR